MGVGFINAEAVVALANAFSNGKIPVSKVLSVVDKDCNTVSVRANIRRIWGPISWVLSV